MWILIGTLFVLAYIGIVVPLIPDIPFMLGGFLLYQFFLSKGGLGTGFWITVIALTVFLVVIDYVATGIAVKKSGGSTLSILVAMLGILIVPLIIGPLGIVVGPFLAVFVFELVKRGTLIEALKVAGSTFMGLLGSIIVKFFVITFLLIWFFTQL